VEWIEECAAFPNAAQDDMVDAWSQAACRFRTSSSGIADYYKEEAQLAGLYRSNPFQGATRPDSLQFSNATHVICG
jgi:hypothetical protein